MRLQTIKIKAQDCPSDVFVYMPKIKRFMFVDVVEIEKDCVTLIFEEDIDKISYQVFKPSEMLTIVSYYKINAINLKS